jgi:type IV pilus assembly protein PilE
MGPNRDRGFTLIELMIVVVIIAVLASIGYPMYQQQVQTARRADGKAALMGAAQRMERCFTQNATYEDCVAFPFTSPDGYYQIDDDELTENTFTIEATPVGPQVADTRCGTLSMTHDGQRAATGTLGAECW